MPILCFKMELFDVLVSWKLAFFHSHYHWLWEEKKFMMPKNFLYSLTFTVASFYSIVDHSGHCVSCKECIKTVKCVSQVKKIYGSNFIDQYSPVNSRVPLKVTYFQHKSIITRVHQCCKMGLHWEHYLELHA